MTQAVTDLRSLRPLLFEHEPAQLAVLTGAPEDDIHAARSETELDILFRLAFSEAPTTAPMPRPVTDPQPVGPSFATTDPVIRLPAGHYAGTITCTHDTTIEAVGDVTWWSGAGGCLQIPPGVSVRVSGVRFLCTNSSHTAPLISAAGDLCGESLQLAPRTGAGIEVTGKAALEDVTIEGGEHGVIVRAGTAKLRRVRCASQRQASITVFAAGQATLEDVSSRGSGSGLLLQGGAVTATGLEVLGAGQDGIVVGAGGRLDGGGGGAVRGCQGDGVRVLGRGQARLSGWMLEENAGAGLLVLSQGRAALHQVTMRSQLSGVVVDVGGVLMHRASTLPDITALQGATVRQRQDVLSDVVTVDLTGSGDCPTIAAALDLVEQGGLVRIMPGTYDEQVDIDIDIRIIGIGAPGDVIWCGGGQLLRARNCSLECHNITFRREASRERRDMLWLRSCAAVIRDCRFEQSGRSAIVVDEKSRAEVRDCRFSKPHQGGVVVRESSEAIIEDCSFMNSHMAAIHVRLQSRAEVRRCRITGSNQGGLLAYEGARLVAEDCELRACTRAGIEVREDAHAQLRRVRLLQGQQAGIFVHKGGHVEAVMCDIVADGRLSRPGVEAQERGRLELDRCRIRGSDAAICCRGASRIALDRCDLSGNRRLKDGDRSSKVEIVRCRHRKVRSPLNVLLIELDTLGAVWPVPANPAGADLRGAFLPDADLSELQLDGALLDGAFLAGASLRDASARRASLVEAFIQGADLEGADLEGADLSQSYLRRASVVGAKLDGAVMTGADTKGMVR